VNPLRLDAYHRVAKEGTIMDPHFNEYIAAIAGMADIYGERPEDHPSEFHDERQTATIADPLLVEPGRQCY